MATDSGLSASDAQYMICKGTYGGKQWSPSEKQAACQRYEELTHTKLDNTLPVDPLAVLAFSLLIVVVAALVFYRYKNRRKRITKVPRG